VRTEPEVPDVSILKVDDSIAGIWALEDGLGFNKSSFSPVGDICAGGLNGSRYLKS
jgi:hypothetical protein